MGSLLIKDCFLGHLEAFVDSGKLLSLALALPPVPGIGAMAFVDDLGTTDIIRDVVVNQS